MENAGYSIAGLMYQAETFEEAAAKLWDDLGIKLVLRQRAMSRSLEKDFPNMLYHDFKRGYQLVEDADYLKAHNKAYLCTAETGFYLVPPTESVIFVSETGEPSGELLYLNSIYRANSSY